MIKNQNKRFIKIKYNKPIININESAEGNFKLL